MSAPDDPAMKASGPGWRWAGRVVVACAGVVLAIVAFGFHPVGDYFTESDFYGGYAQGARLIQQGALDPSRYGPYGPVYDALLAIMGFATGDLFDAARLVAVISATVVLALALRLGTHLAGPVAGFWLVLLMAVNPTFFRYGYSVGTDMPGNALWLASLTAVVTASGRTSQIGGGILAGLAALTRYNLATVVPAALILLFTARDSARTRLRAAGVFMGAFLLAVVPFTLFATAAGHPPAATLFRDAVFYLDDAPQRALESRYVGPDAKPEVDAPPQVQSTTVVRRLLTGVPSHLASDARELLGWPVALLALASLVFLAVRRRAGVLLPLLPFFAITFVALAPVFYSTRYSMALLPAYLAPAAVAMAVATKAGGLWRAVAAIAAAAALVASGSSCVRLQRAVYESIPRETLAAGQALRSVAEPTSRVLARKAHVAYAAGIEPVLMPRLTTLEALGEFCRDREITHIYYSWYEARLRPAFGFLLDTSATVPGLVPVHATLHHPSATYRVESALGQDPAWWSDSLARQHIERRVNTLLSMEPDETPERYLALAAEALSAGRFEDALSDAVAAGRWMPDRIEPALLQGESLRRLGRSDEALAVFDGAISRHPETPPLRIGRGAALLDLGRGADAAREWRSHVQAVRDPILLRDMHTLYSAIGDTAAANEVMRTWLRVRQRR